MTYCLRTLSHLYSYCTCVSYITGATKQDFLYRLQSLHKGEETDDEDQETDDNAEEAEDQETDEGDAGGAGDDTINKLIN